MNVQTQVEEFYDVIIIGAGPVGGIPRLEIQRIGTHRIDRGGALRNRKAIPMCRLGESWCYGKSSDE